jgi:hypothetical protein
MAQYDPSDTTGDLVRAKAVINEANMRTYVSGDPWDWLQREGQWTTVAGSDVYTYASIATAMGFTGSTIREIHAMTQDAPDGTFLGSRSWEQLEFETQSVKDSGESVGMPYLWSKWGGNPGRVRLYPSPDAVYTLGAFVLLKQDRMTSDSDLPLMPADWAEAVLVPYAAARLLEQEGGPEAMNQADRLHARYREEFLAMRTACATFRKPTGNITTPGWDMRDPLRTGDGLWGYR